MFDRDSQDKLAFFAPIWIDLMKEIVELSIEKMRLFDVWDDYSLLSLAAEAYHISVALDLKPALSHVSPQFVIQRVSNPQTHPR